MPVSYTHLDVYKRQVYDALHRKLCQESVLHGDETTLQVLKEPGRTSTSKSLSLIHIFQGHGGDESRCTVASPGSRIDEARKA